MGAVCACRGCGVTPDVATNLRSAKYAPLPPNLGPAGVCVKASLSSRNSVNYDLVFYIEEVCMVQLRLRAFCEV
ncbi:unnamed protein product [Somion occarium]|uniref:Uncharacterized protein n=1 Tax=Somion occarium TaxID=3059160 RepID=A0ABP1CTI1_9APHY